MSESGEELVVIRRRSAFVEADGKSGVWKIAYADFMTAMMAFFLVMWLVNATNQETRESVASYFNPVKLADSTPDRKGVSDPTKPDPGGSEGKAKTGGSAEAAPAAKAAMQRAEPAEGEQSREGGLAAKPPRHDEAALFRDPYAVLTDIAGGPATSARRERRIGIALGPSERQGAKGGEGYRDPFDPIYWQVAPQPSIERRTSGKAERGSLPVDDDLAMLIDGEAKKPPEGRLDATVATSGYIADATAPEAENPSAVPQAPAQRKDAAPRAAPLSPAAEAPPSAGSEAAQTPAASGPHATSAKPEPLGQANSSEAATLQAAIRSVLEAAPKPGPAVAVEQTDEGLLVSLTDSANFGMFAIGSAEPQPELVRTIDKVAPLLAEHSGTIVVRGHTDARPFRTQNYDNWRLSSARAHMAYHMLLRGGVDPQRIERIEGYADRRLKLAGDPLAAPNRRIEILVKRGRP